MTPEEMVGRIRAGDPDGAVTTFLEANPEISPDVLAANALTWNLDDVTQAILEWVIERQPENWECRKQLGLLHLGRNEFDAAKPHFEALMAGLPDNYVGYWGESVACSRQGDQDGLRQTIQKAQATMPEGTYVNWQDGALLRDFPDDEAISRARAHFETLLTAERARRADPRRGDKETSPAPGPSKTDSRPVAVETANAVEIGNQGAMLSGRLENARPNSQYWFEYGTAPDDLSEETTREPVPGPLNARLTVDPTISGLKGRFYGSKLQWTDSGGGTLVLEWPFGKDANHISGIGFLDLMFGIWHNANYPIGPQDLPDAETTDLRDARVDLKLWTDGLDAKDFLHCVGVGNGDAYWGLTGAPLDLNDAPETGVFSMSFTLSASPEDWTFFGSNSREQQDAAGRYGYGPLADALSKNSGNIVFAGMFGDWRETPTGNLGLKRMDVTYRDRNLLHPDNGAELVTSPDRPTSPPERLANGRRGRLEDAWYSLGRLEEPMSFEWRLPESRDIRTLVFHQDWLMPVETCRITLTTEDGEAHSWDVSLPAPTDPFNDPLVTKLQLPGGKKFTNVGLTLLAGHSMEGTALTSFEALSEEPPPATNGPVSVVVSEDIGDLADGSQIYYRLCCLDGETLTKGEIADIRLPTGHAPVVHDLSLISSSAADGATIGVRANPMGFDATLEWRLDDEDDWRRIPLGWEQTPVTRVISTADLPAGLHRVEVRATMDGQSAGAAKKLEFRIPS